ncbi:MAG TPA: pyridoxal-phosphate dependent enzyme [Woeseiaceae bacterium]|nr:pyridoxal-phosphate dependent enzyme [Woeseiaceae bacterium]
MLALEPPRLDDVRAAANRVHAHVIRAPLVRLNADLPRTEIYLKLESLQPTGAFKIRPAANAILNAPPRLVAEGVYTASSGNMAQGVAWMARTLGLAATVLLPRDAAATKVAALRRLGATIRVLRDSEWWQVLADHGDTGSRGLFVHPVANQDVINGNATIGLEIHEELPDADTVLVPFGGGGLSSGIASAMRAAGSRARILGAESDHCTPLAVAQEAGKPLSVPIRPCFISGIGVGRILDEMWPLIKELVDGAVVASTEEVAAAIRLLFERHRVIAEGAGAAPVAAALAGRAGTGKIVCVVSGGNLDERYLTDILQGRPARMINRRTQ